MVISYPFVPFIYVLAYLLYRLVIYYTVHMVIIKISIHGFPPVKSALLLRLRISVEVE